MLNLIELAKNIILSVSTILTGSSFDKSADNHIFLKGRNEFENDDKLVNVINSNLKPKMIIKPFSNSDRWSFMFHRSHRSHSSHRSHYSSRSGTTSETRSSSSTRKSSNNNTNSTSNFKLGDRVLNKGLKGNDVIELRLLLKDKGYYVPINDQNFDTELLEAVKKYQKDNKLKANGIVDVVTLYSLKNK